MDRKELPGEEFLLGMGLENEGCHSWIDKDSTLRKIRDAPGLGRVGPEDQGGEIPVEISHPPDPKIPGSPTPLSTRFSSFSSPGLSFYTRVLENCEDEAKFEEVGEVFHPFYPTNPTSFPRIPSPFPDFCWHLRCLLLDTGGKIPTEFSKVEG